MSRRAFVALALAVSVSALGVHWLVRGRDAVAQSTSSQTQSAPSQTQSAASRAQSAPSNDEIGDQVQTVPRGQMPVFAGEGDAGALYRFATTRGDVLRFMPCTCGCAQVGHTSNRSCYIKGETAADVTYTSHAAT